MKLLPMNYSDFWLSSPFFSVAVVFWTLAGCGVHSCWYPDHNWESTLGRSGLCESRSYAVQWFCCIVCTNSNHHGEFYFSKIRNTLGFFNLCLAFILRVLIVDLDGSLQLKNASEKDERKKKKKNWLANWVGLGK